MVQGSVPKHLLPRQPEKVNPGEGKAVRVIRVPASKAASHVFPQRIPLGVLVTLPVPVIAILKRT